MDAVVPTECTGGDTYLFVLNTLGAGDTLDIEDGMAPGFNLDGVTELGDLECPGPADDTDQGTRNPWNPIFHWPDLTGTPGISNGLAASPIGELLPGMMASMLPEAMQAGEILILAKLDHVDDFQNDDCVEASLLMGGIPADALPEPGTVTDQEMALAIAQYLDPDWDPEDEESVHQIAPGREFDVLADSFDANGDPLVFARGAIVDGGLEFQQAGLELNLGALALVLDTARLSFSPSATALQDGVLGGILPVDALAAVLAGLLPGGGDPEDLANQIAPYADQGWNETEERCSALSVGFTFEAVDAVLGEILEPDPEPDAGVGDAGAEDAATEDAATEDAATEG
jgi:hypothetical protein